VKEVSFMSGLTNAGKNTTIYWIIGIVLVVVIVLAIVLSGGSSTSNQGNNTGNTSGTVDTTAVTTALNSLDENEFTSDTADDSILDVQ